jgi:hypothetical protein
MKEIPLTQGKVALVDDSDFERLSAHKWYAHKAKTLSSRCSRTGKRFRRSLGGCTCRGKEICRTITSLVR